MQAQQSEQRQRQIDLALAQDGGGRADARQAGAQPQGGQRPAGAGRPLDQAVMQFAVFGQPGGPRQDALLQVGRPAQGGLAGGAVFQRPPMGLPQANGFGLPVLEQRTGGAGIGGGGAVPQGEAGG